VRAFSVGDEIEPEEVVDGNLEERRRALLEEHDSERRG
jgi:hypothetical protein